MVARELVYLGYAVAVHVEDDAGASQIIKFTRPKAGLFTNHDGTAIYILPLDKPRPAEVPTGRAKGKKLWRAWSEFEVDGAFRLSVPKSKLELFKCGYASAIIYDSDKWTGKWRKYIHEFTGQIPAYCNKGRRPSVFGVLSVDGKKLVTARGLVG